MKKSHTFLGTSNKLTTSSAFFGLSTLKASDPKSNATSFQSLKYIKDNL